MIIDEYSGYIEIKNIGDKSVDLENYSLSNDANVSFKWQFPSIKLSKGETVVVFTTGKTSLSGELSTSFKLKNKHYEKHYLKIFLYPPRPHPRLRSSVGSV